MPRCDSEVRVPGRSVRWRLGLSALVVLSSVSVADASSKRPLDQGWRLESSANVTAKGDRISMPGFKAESWQAISVPNTVVGALVESGVYPDPYFGMNLRKIPGTTYPIGERFTLLPTPQDSPFRVSWWYRAEFDLPDTLAGRALSLHFDGINYRANIWVNGRHIANAREVVGVFRRYEFDVSPLLHVGGRNAVAVEVFGPEPHDLSIMWVDWNPTPPDKNMGLWGDVYLTDSGPVALRHPYVTSKLDLPSLDTAHLTVSAEVWNTTDKAIKATLRGAIESIRLSKDVSLAPGEHTTVTFSSNDVRELNVAQPRIWWPYRMGAQPLYTLALDVVANGQPSDHTDVRFGIQQIDSELTKEGHRLFKVNGKPILVRGGGWASDMLLRPASRERLEAELRYTREMGLNTIRLEGKLEGDLFYDLADAYGILVMPGWCCCDQWEQWDKWDAEDHRVGPESLRDQALRLRSHPSVMAWMNGSDFPPPAAVEGAYLKVLDGLRWSKPVLSNATDAPGPVSGPSGLKMRGPYDYVPPSYWLTDTKNGGAFGFATEIGPGAAVPPLESLKTMLPADKLWPMNEYWKYHAGGDEFKDIRLFTAALEGRYGAATSAEDFARKAQALTYEGQRAMFEGYARNKYTSTGVIQWMLNNAWPSMIWHLYDYYLRPGGGYYGTRKACEVLHVQYSYDDRSITIVNDGQQSFQGLKVSATLLDLNLTPRFTGDAVVDVGPDAVVRTLTIPAPADLTTTYFLRLELRDTDNAVVSTNFYWLSTRDDELEWDKTEWYYTPTKQHADLTALTQLPSTTLTAALSCDPGLSTGERCKATISNTGTALAFQVHMKLIDRGTAEEILPVFWEDNYIALLPGETRQIRVELSSSHRGLAIEAEAWNASRVQE